MSALGHTINEVERHRDSQMVCNQKKARDMHGAQSKLGAAGVGGKSVKLYGSFQGRS